MNCPTYINGIIVQNEQVVSPASLQADVIGIAHEGHLGVDKILSLLRETCWFPGMSEKVRTFVKHADHEQQQRHCQINLFFSIGTLS